MTLDLTVDQPPEDAAATTDTTLAWLAAAVAAWIVLRGVARLIGGLIEWHAANIEDDWDE